MRDVNINFSDDPEKLELAKDTAYVRTQLLTPFEADGGAAAVPSLLEQMPIAAVGLSADTASKEGKNARHASSSGIRYSTRGPGIGFW